MLRRIIFFTLYLTLTFLLGETHVDISTLCGVHFQIIKLT